MDEVKTIRNLEELVDSSLEKGEKIVGSEVFVLTAPGENFGSIVLRIIIKVKNEHTGDCRVLDAVGKIIPESKRIQEMVNVQVTFRNEYSLYSKIVPLLRDFLKEKEMVDDVDFTAPFYGGRININNDLDRDIDTDAIILMKNLKSIGYSTGEKLVGLNTEAAKIVINSLVRLHTVALAFRLQHTKQFDEQIKPYFTNYVPESDFLQMVKESLLFTLQNNGFTEKEIAKVSAAMERGGHKKEINNMWGTMIHYDTWTNNLMIQYKENKPVHCMIVDFQDFGYGSPLNDLMFFLFTSVQKRCFRTDLEELLRYYYQQFIENLEKLGVNTDNYTKLSYKKEIWSAVKNYEYCHAMWMLVIIMCNDVNSMEELLDNKSKNKIMNWSEKHVQKVIELTRICLKKNWI